jgi:hypothetical protein
MSLMGFAIMPRQLGTIGWWLIQGFPGDFFPAGAFMRQSAFVQIDRTAHV